jgi:phage tail tape-measure protein
MVATAEPVMIKTSERVNDKIRRQTEARIMSFSMHPEQIDQRLRELDAEWDIDRVIEASAAGATLFGSVMGLLGGRKWFLLTGVAAAFLLQHAVQGWSPPLPLFRRVGVRTAKEIEAERVALRALRGDFRDLGEGQRDLQRIIQAAFR